MVLPSTPTSVWTSAASPLPDDELSSALLLQPEAAATTATVARMTAPRERLPGFMTCSLVLVGRRGRCWSEGCRDWRRNWWGCPFRGRGPCGGTVGRGR